MNIYNKRKGVQNRIKLYDNEQGIDNNFWTFEPTKKGNYYINYEVPPSLDGQPKSGCVILLIGYVNTN